MYTLRFDPEIPGFELIVPREVAEGLQHDFKKMNVDSCAQVRAPMRLKGKETSRVIFPLTSRGAGRIVMALEHVLQVTRSKSDREEHFFSAWSLMNGVVSGDFCTRLCRIPQSSIAKVASSMRRAFRAASATNLQRYAVSCHVRISLKRQAFSLHCYDECETAIYSSQTSVPREPVLFSSHSLYRDHQKIAMLAGFLTLAECLQEIP